MAEIQAAKTSPPECERPSTFEAVLAGALFASTLQPNGSPSPEQVSAGSRAGLRPPPECQDP